MNSASVFSAVILLHKEAGPTSAASLNRLKREDARLGRKARLGHSGTLDSFATGLLVCFSGRYTPFAGQLTGFYKAYRARIDFRHATDTLDPLGQVTVQNDPAGAAEVLAEAWQSGRLKSLVDEHLSGHRLQQPPDFSARKVGGKRASDLARAGQAVKLKPKEVHLIVNRLEYQPPYYVDVDLTVSSGTYIRAWGRDLGELLGLPCHLKSLERYRVGPFSLDEPADVKKPGSVAVIEDASWLKQIVPSFQIEPDSEVQRVLATGKKIPFEQIRPSFAFQNRPMSVFGLFWEESDVPAEALLWYGDRPVYWITNISWQNGQIRNYTIKKNFFA